MKKATAISIFCGLLVQNYTLADNNVDGNDTIDHLDNYDALFIPGSRAPYTSEEMTHIRNWLMSKTKVLFIGGDSDYSGYFNASASINPLLEFLGSSIRLDAGAIADATNNDGMSYRVLATQPGNGTIGSIVNVGIKQILLHGPTAIYGYMNNAPVDLRNTTIPNVEVLFYYSNTSQPLDQDVSDSEADFYFKHGSVIGNYPAVVVERINSSYLVLAGEALFTDYKNMFGIRGEHGTPLDNYAFVIQLLNYVLKDIKPRTTPTPTNIGNTSVLYTLIGILGVPVYTYLRRYRR